MILQVTPLLSLRNGFCFTDGCGRASGNFTKHLARSLQILEPVTGLRYRPCAFQIRFKGYKGMLVEDPTLNSHGETVKMRPSQRKFRMREVEGNWDSDQRSSVTPIASTFGVVDHSKPISLVL